ncbi:MAG: MotA/TolQ/ExbB proton channel family protein [Planctomycetota bacterium]
MLLALGLWIGVPGVNALSGRAHAQEAGSGADAAATDSPAADQPATELDERLRAAEQMAETVVGDETADQGQGSLLAPFQDPEKMNFLELLMRGRWLMLPIAVMSLLVVAVGAERLLGLRRPRVVPSRLIAELEGLAGEREGFDPRQAYKLCQKYPSAAAKVVRAMLLKIGRPHSELEQAISRANEREAAHLYSNVRWLNLAAGVTPLLGLLGTVWGMIEAFFQTANLPLGANKAEYLADGIWKALVTTFAGLAVAIPAAVLAHYFEGRIQKLFRELDESLQGLLPQLERYEGRLRMSKDQLERPDSRPDAAATADRSKKKRPTASPK